MTPAFEATATFAPLMFPQAKGNRPLPRAALWVHRLLRPLGRVSPEAMDASTGLFNRAGLFAAARQEVGRHAAGAPVAAIVLEFSDLAEVREIYGAPVARKVVKEVVRRLRAAAGRRGLVGRTGAGQFTVILAGLEAHDALGQLHRALGKPARVEFDAGDSEIVLVPDFVVDEMDAGAGAVQPLYRSMARELERNRKDERRRLHYLASERERHSRPMLIRD